MGATQSEIRLARLIDERELTRSKHESKLAEIEGRDDQTLTPSDAENVKAYRERAADLDIEISDLADEIKRHKDSVTESAKIRRVLAGNNTGVEDNGDGVVYRTMAAYARDVLMTSEDRYARSAVEQSVSREQINRAQERLQAVERLPATTLTSDIAGLTPPQHIAEIMQIIDNSRPLVEAAGRKATLRQLQVTYPQVDGTPIVSVQTTQKTEAGNVGLDVSMVTKTASTYLGGGNISWQAIEFSDPNTLDLWFREIAADYAYKTELDAATVVSASAFTNVVTSPLGATPTYVELMAAIGAGGGKVYASSGRMANAVIVAPDRYWYVMGLATSSPFGFGGGSGGIDLQSGRPALRVIASRGLNAGEIIVGDLDGLLVAENAGAPVRLMVSEPAIAGVEVGLVGAFEAAVVDDGAFALVTTAS